MTTPAEHLAVLDAAAPGLVLGAWVVGSTALDDFIPGVSDLDLICELARDPDPAVLAAAQRPDLDVIYLGRGELDKQVDDARSIAWGRNGVLNTTERADLVPVLWEQLRGYAIRVRGRTLSPPVTIGQVEAYCRANLTGYWEPLLARAAVGFTRTVDPLDRRRAVLWLGSGPARLWHTIGTGRIVGKTQALTLAATRWPDLAPAIDRIAAARRDSGIALSAEHSEAALELGRRVSAAV